MKLELRVGRAFGNAPGDGLDVIKRLAPGAGDISEQAGPAAAGEQVAKLGRPAQQLRPDRHPPSDRVALLLRARIERRFEQPLAQPLELGRRQEVAGC